MKKIILLFTVVFLSIPFLTFAQGCMEASSDEGVNVVGYLQSQFEYQFNEDDNENSFTFNRARMGLVGNIPYDFSYYIMFEFSQFQNGPYLLDGFITYSRLAPWASISMGQFKSPFSLELNTPCQGLHTINRSMVVTQLANPDRDRGIMFTGKYEKLLKYGLAFTNGRGRDKEEDNLNKAISGRIVISPIDFISVGAGYKAWHDPARDEDGEIIADADDDERSRYSVDFELKYDNILVQGEYIAGEDVGSSPVWGG
ncbi:MAG: porin [Candidatus Cloacimonadota bacterium]|nr:porin [Candidatus Cloacimonadota bacterium]